nr:MAG TPA: hypothetical protein [Caudoviricetes sp.]
MKCSQKYSIIYLVLTEKRVLWYHALRQVRKGNEG